jgi:5-methylcytosine-specific restriction endonuclease McrA
MKPYSSTTWTKLRDKKLKEQPECMMCKCFDRHTPADQVHHIIKFAE